ncbi:4383_t:CDS:2, partial [Cetraspora pellucida]
KLKEEQYAKYKKCFTINALRETHWNSFYAICLSFLRSQKALQILVIKFKPPISETLHARTEHKLKCKIYEIIKADQMHAHESILEQQSDFNISAKIDSMNKANIKPSNLTSENNLSFVEDKKI